MNLSSLLPNFYLVHPNSIPGLDKCRASIYTFYKIGSDAALSQSAFSELEFLNSDATRSINHPYTKIPAIMTNDPLAEQALQAAYSGDWQKAILVNQQILDHQPDNLDALNRLAKAYLETNQPDLALRIYQQVLSHDPYNSIAQKNLRRLEHYSPPDTSAHPLSHSPITSFIEEPGISKTVQLTCPGEPTVLAQVDAGDSVSLQIRRRLIYITTSENTHLGRIPEDLSIRLINLIKGGNQYQAWVKSVDGQNIKIFIKESYRTPKFQDIPSFPEANQSSYLAFTDPARVYEDRPDTTSIDEQE